MNDRLRHFLSVVLAVATMAAQAVCVCPVAAAEAGPVPKAEEPCRGSGKCCVQDTEEPAAPAPARSQESDPCDSCNVVHPADRIQPERQDAAVSVHQQLLALAPVPTLYTPVPAGRFAERAGAERVPIPPLLQDLFHSGTLLLI
jgi:hypothetical protein